MAMAEAGEWRNGEPDLLGQRLLLPVLGAQTVA